MNEVYITGKNVVAIISNYNCISYHELFLNIDLYYKDDGQTMLADFDDNKFRENIYMVASAKTCA